MRAALVIVALAGALHGQAQRDSSAVHRSRWSIGVQGSLDHCFRALHQGSSTMDLGWFIDHRNDLEQPRTGYSAGAVATYRPREHWWFSAGLGFVSQGYRLEGIPFATIDAPEGDPAARLADVTLFYEYLQLPLTTGYRIGTGRLDWLVALGVSPEVLLEVRSHVEVARPDGGTDVYTYTSAPYGYEPMNVVALGQLGAEYALSDRFALRLMGNGRYGLLVLNAGDIPIKEHLWSIGGLLGLNYRL